MARKMKDSGIEWIGEIPEGWEIAKAKYFIDISHGSDPKTQGFIPVYGSGSESFKTCGEYKEGPAVLIGRKGATLHIPHYIEGKYWNVDTAFDVKSKSHCILKFYYYLAACFDYKYYISQTTLPGMTQSNYYNMFLPVPSLSKQFQIATYLDAHGAAFDFLISKVRSSIEEYKKLKQAVITQAVTKGVRGEREMKDSGVEWIGEIPVEWSVQRIKTIFSIRNERNFLPLEQVNLISLYTDKGVIQHCDIEKTTGNKASNADGYKKVCPNDMIVNIILCWMGAIGRSDYAGVTSPAYDVYVPSPEIECRFYHYYFRTLGFSGDCYKNGRGIMAMRWRTYSDQFRSIKVVVPPLEEQKEIVDYLDAKCAEIDKLIAKKEQLVKELESYKKSLIYEVVTGKREV
jgi:type I restriction enzyme S subunit